MDCRARVASGEVDVRSRAERRRISSPHVARQRVAGESRGVDARQRSRLVRQRQGDGALEHQPDDGQPERRRDREGSARKSHGAPARDGGRPGASRRRRAATDRRGGGSARRACARARGSGGGVEGHHQLSGCRRVVRSHRSDEANDRRGPDTRPAVGNGARRRGRKSRRSGARTSGGLRRQPAHGPRDQGADRRRPRVARCLAARAICR